MPTRSALLLGVICFGFVAAQASQGEPPTARDAKALKADRPVRTDRYGDPLPQSVVARLGTERLTLGKAIFLTFSPDGRRLAAHNGHDRLRVWDAASGKELLRLTTPAFRGYGSGMAPLAFSPDGKAIALACPAEDVRGGNRQATVRVWEVATGKELHCFGGLKGQAIHLAFSPDGRYLFAGGGIPLLRWDLAKGGEPKEYGDFQSVAFLAVSRDGNTLTAASNDRQDWQKRTFARWDVATGKEMGRHTLITEGSWAGALSPEGNIFAAPDADGKSIALLDPLTGRELRQARESEYPAFISFSADGAAMTCSSKDGTTRVWDTATGKLRARIKALPTSVQRTALSPDGKRLALSGRADDAVHLWDVAASRELHSFAGHRGGPLTLAFRKDGKEIATVSRDSAHVGPYVTEWAEWSFRRWDAATGVEQAVTSDNPKGEVHLTAFSADGRRLATVIHDGTLHLWDVEAGKELRNWKVPTWESTTIWNDRKGGKTVIKTPHPAITKPVFSPDGKTLLAAEGPKVYRWKTATGRELPAFEVEGTSRPPTWCLPSPDGRTLLVWGWVNRAQVVLLDAASGKIKQRLKDIGEHPNSPAFSPDGRTVAVVEADEVTLWEVASGRSRGRLTVPRMTFALAFSPDGRFLATGGYGESPVNLWDLATGGGVGSLRDDCGRVELLAFSPDGSRLAVAGDSPTVLIGDVAEMCGKKKVEEIAKSTTPTAEELQEAWVALTGADGAHAYRALHRLGLAGPRGAAFLRARLKGDKPPDERRIARLIGDLDADKFATREKAFAELSTLGVRAEPALRRRLEDEVSAEVRSRVNRLLERLGTPQGSPPSPELIRQRVVEALEANGTKDARQALAELAEEAADAPLTREAKASLERLSRQPRP